MVSKYNKLFTTVSPLEQGPITVLVEYINGRDNQIVTVRSLEGEHGSRDEYMRARDQQGNPFKVSSSLLPLTLSGAQQLVDALSGALRAAQEP